MVPQPLGEGGRFGEATIRISKLQLGLALSAALIATASASQPPANVTIHGSRVYPESLTADAAGNLYNGSNGGTIYRALKRAKTAEPWIVPDAHNGLRSLFGVFADDAH